MSQERENCGTNGLLHDDGEDQACHFTIFSFLPTELQLKIWRETWEERVVTISRKYHGPNVSVTADATEEQLKGRHSRAIREQEPFADGDKLLINTTTCSRATLSVTLWVSRQSRLETLRHYELCMGLPGGTTTVYFNFSLDTLRFPYSPLVPGSVQPRDLARVQKLAIPERCPYTSDFAQVVEKQRKLLEQDSDVAKENFQQIGARSFRVLNTVVPSLREIWLDHFYESRRQTMRALMGEFTRSQFIDGIPAARIPANGACFFENQPFEQERRLVVLMKTYGRVPDLVNIDLEFVEQHTLMSTVISKSAIGSATANRKEVEAKVSIHSWVLKVAGAEIDQVLSSEHHFAAVCNLDYLLIGFGSHFKATEEVIYSIP
ncbi:uncharacterized protein JN550_001583 [Neoarthrinium moseri]|uniref:uncharacterized protein n=1 Tax=Neoarthrinium moseri TaxID=1658444 RepID=UPI001FDC3B6E|nr:uncharacterized protein JN550_001583 [Neoarthrinium moseri]KAI1876087.1 hypothetical protein JN550_001583 [Neoarthrinium moseri]